MNVLDNSWLAQNNKHDQYIWSKGWIREELKSSPVERFRPDKFSWPVFRACFRIVGWTPFSSVGFWKAAFLFAKGFLPLVAISLPHTFYNFTHRRAFVERCFRRPKKIGINLFKYYQARMINRDINNKMLLYYVLGLYYTSLELIKKNLNQKIILYWKKGEFLITVRN